jgi:hypothetical protein
MIHYVTANLNIDALQTDREPEVAGSRRISMIADLLAKLTDTVPRLPR